MEGRSTAQVQVKTDEKTTNSSEKPKKTISQTICAIYEKLIGVNDKKRLQKSLEKLITLCNKKGFISSEEQKMIKNIIDIDDTKVFDVMIPRADIVAISNTAKLKEIKDLIINEEHSRIPVYGANLDEVIGFIHSKDLVKFLSKGTKEFVIEDFLRKIIYVPHSMRIMDLLRKMRASQVHIAIVLDEYGGTDGLITIEDIMEEIVGEIEDEHDSPNNDIYHKINEVSKSVFHFGGRVDIEEVEELLQEKIVKEDTYDFETIGGFVLSEMKKIPKNGDILKINSNLSLKILEADPRSIKLIEITKEPNSEQN